jgi:hypothetical protein
MSDYSDAHFSKTGRVFDALVAATEGKPGAAKEALEGFLEIFPRHREELPGAKLLSQVRPADYYEHG